MPHLQRARELGFSHACAAPIFAPRPGRTAFLTDDHDAADPRLGPCGSADEATVWLAAHCRQAGLGLVLDVVLDRVAADGATARRWADVFIPSADDKLDPRTDLSMRAAATKAKPSRLAR